MILTDKEKAVIKMMRQGAQIDLTFQPRVVSIKTNAQAREYLKPFVDAFGGKLSHDKNKDGSLWSVYKVDDIHRVDTAYVFLDDSDFHKEGD